MQRRVVITGIGPVTPVGVGLDKFWDSLKNGKSGISQLSDAITKAYECYAKIPVEIGGEIKDLDVASYFSDRKIVRSIQKDMDKVSRFAVLSSKLALDDAKFKLKKEGAEADAEEAFAGVDLHPSRVATFLGTGIGGISTTCDDALTLVNKGMKSIGIRSIIKLMPNAASGHIGIINGFQGRAKSDATACASGLDSIVDAYWYIKNNQADVMVTGGTEACLNPLALASFYNMTALSRRECAPEEASCPFDRKRDGFVMSEGACSFVLEELETAKKRGAHIYAELVGVGASCDAYHITAPSEDGTGGALAINNALNEAGLADNREAIDYIHAHGTSTPLNDARETKAIKNVFGDHAYKLAVSSTKSMTGHLIGAAGPTGMAAATMAIKDGIMPPTINLKDPDPECDLDYVANEAKKRDVNYSLVQALGFGGHNTVCVLKKFQG
jgi:3-oxoacyl-[acyl-carrier-protein] synthase II